MHGEVGLGWVAFGAIYWFAHSLATELGNRIAERSEDEVNRPERTAFCHQVGFPVLRTVTVVSWLVVAAMDVGLLIRSPRIPLALLLIAAAAFGIGYSFGPHLKRHPLAALFILTFPFSGTFLIGWTARPPAGGLTADEFFHQALPFAVLLGSLIASIGGAKDLTDRVGDAAVGYRSVWVEAVRRHSVLMLAAITLAPFIYIVAATVTGVLPARNLLLCLLLPLSWWFPRAAGGAQTPAEAGALREIGYTYCGVFVVLAVCLNVPSVGTLLVSLASIVYWFIATEYLHWTDGLRLSKIRLLANRPRRRATETRS
jgi:4-hydroxybenzoate polyprenyltransferase